MILCFVWDLEEDFGFGRKLFRSLTSVHHTVHTGRTV
jgi:hypothetical protein